MNIVVLAGGTSTERDVSIMTGKLVCESLRRNGHRANMLDVFLGTRDYADPKAFFETGSDLERLAAAWTEQSKGIAALEADRKRTGGGFFGPMVLEICRAADIVFLGLHGANGEDGKIQAVFDLMGIQYTGSDYLSSAVAMDKQLTKKVLITEGIPMPKGITLKKGHKIEYAPLPCVVKPCCGGSSVGVTVVENEADFAQAVEEAFRYEETILVEEYIKGREFSVAVLDGKALPVIEIEPLEGFYDYRSKYVAGATRETCPAQLPAELADKMMRWAEKACEAVGIQTYARVDEMLDKDQQIFCLEINTLPGMTPTSLIPQEAAAAGMSYDQLTQKIVDSSLAKYQTKPL